MLLIAREFFTVDLRGLRAALAARAARDGVTESDVLRSAPVVALGSDGSDRPTPCPDPGAGPLSPPRVKLSVRLPRLAAQRLDQNARAAGLSRGTYLARLIDGAPPVVASADRAAGFAALSAYATELAALSREIHHLTSLLRQDSVRAAQEYREMLDKLTGDVRGHLMLAASVLADLRPRSRSAGQGEHPAS